MNKDLMSVPSSNAKADKQSGWVGNDDNCVMCGDYVPEGRRVCLSCERDSQHALKKKVICNEKK